VYDLTRDDVISRVLVHLATAERYKERCVERNTDGLRAQES
jgi:hypothetical protein